MEISWWAGPTATCSKLPTRPARVLATQPTAPSSALVTSSLYILRKYRSSTTGTPDGKPGRSEKLSPLVPAKFEEQVNIHRIFQEISHHFCLKILIIYRSDWTVPSALSPVTLWVVDTSHLRKNDFPLNFRRKLTERTGTPSLPPPPTDPPLTPPPCLMTFYNPAVTKLDSLPPRSTCSKAPTALFSPTVQGEISSKFQDQGLKVSRSSVFLIASKMSDYTITSKTNGQFVTCDNAGNGPLIASRKNAGSYCTFYVSPTHLQQIPGRVSVSKARHTTNGWSKRTWTTNTSLWTVENSLPRQLMQTPTLSGPWRRPNDVLWRHHLINTCFTKVSGVLFLSAGNFVPIIRLSDFFPRDAPQFDFSTHKHLLELKFKTALPFTMSYILYHFRHMKISLNKFQRNRKDGNSSVVMAMWVIFSVPELPASLFGYRHQPHIWWEDSPMRPHLREYRASTHRR